ETLLDATPAPIDERSLRRLRMLRPLLPLAGVTMLLGTLAQQGFLPGEWPLATPILLPLVLLTLSLHEGLALARERAHAEAENRELEAQMQERIAAAERNFNALAEQRLEQVTERERKRIAADLHDDLGAKLLTIVHTSESDRISSLAREALEEMRLSVRGLTGKPVHLLDALGDWRAEVVSRLAQANIQAEWKAGVDEVYTLQARAYVQTTRILRESVSNIIKHSCATTCVFTCAVIDGDFQLTIQDNGNGIQSDAEKRLDGGHGLASMKNRAKQMQGQCLVESGPGFGTVIRLTIPL
ncbi:MAG TPA: ATP-binding protein, partial [Burkholderiaceae bacterium]